MVVLTKATDLPKDIVFYTVSDNRVVEVTDESEIDFFLISCISWKSSSMLLALESYREIYMTTRNTIVTERIQELELKCIRANLYEFNNYNCHGLLTRNMEDITNYMRSLLSLEDYKQRHIFDHYHDCFQSFFNNRYRTRCQFLNLLCRFNIIVFTAVKGYLDYDLPSLY